MQASTTVLSLALLACAQLCAQQNSVGANPSAAAVGQGDGSETANTQKAVTKELQTAAIPPFARPPQQHSLLASLEPSLATDTTDNEANADRGASTVEAPAASTHSAEAAAKDAAQNPVAHMISVPFQNNTFFNVGPYKRSENALLIEPVIPFKLSEKWIVITRTIIPVIYAPRVSPSDNKIAGIGNLNPQFYLSPAHPGKIIWGVGPQLWMPTASDDTLGVNKWGGGPAAVVLTKQGPWLLGALANNVWTGGAGQEGHQSTVDPRVFHSVNQMTLNPFVYYNLPRGWYLVSSEIMTSDWAAHSGNRWTVPIGGGFGRVFKLGTQMLNTRVQFWNDVKTTIGGQGWTMQTQVQFLFPQHR